MKDTSIAQTLPSQDRRVELSATEERVLKSFDLPWCVELIGG